MPALMPAAHGGLVERCTPQTWRTPLPGESAERRRAAHRHADWCIWVRMHVVAALSTCAASGSRPPCGTNRQHTPRVSPPSAQGHDAVAPARPVVALGKFDALHRGHMALAAAAASLGGMPLLLSFSGMAEVLGWPKRLPLVPPCDRSRVLDLWARQLGAAGTAMNGAAPPADASQTGQQPDATQGPSVAVRQRYVPFMCVRSLSPEAFVEVVAHELRAAGVVAGVNYRFGGKGCARAAFCPGTARAFGMLERVGAASAAEAGQLLRPGPPNVHDAAGYKAAGDVVVLQRLAAAHGMGCSIVDLVPVSAAAHHSDAGSGGSGGSCFSGGSGDQSPVSSSMVRGLVCEAAAQAARNTWRTRRTTLCRTTCTIANSQNTHTHPSAQKIRELLALGDVVTVEQLMGRPYRLVAAIAVGQQQHTQAGRPGSDPCSSRSSAENTAGNNDGSGSGRGGSGSDDVGGAPYTRVVSTSSMDGTESGAAPLRLREGGQAVLVASDGLLNAAPGAGRYTANLTLHLGATPADELLLLEADTAEAAASSDGSSNGHPSAAARRCMEWRGATVQLCRDGVTMPSAPILQALAGSLAGTGPSQALLVLDFKQRVA